MADHDVDILHSYLGLAALSILGHPEVRPINACLCVSQRSLDVLARRSEQALDQDKPASH